MNAVIAAMSSLTVSNDSRRIACRVMIPKNISTRFSHDPEVGVKCMLILGFFASHFLHVDLLVGVVVIGHHTQPLSRVGAGDALHEVEELRLPVPVVAAVGDLPGGDLQRLSDERCVGSGGF